MNTPNWLSDCFLIYINSFLYPSYPNYPMVSFLYRDTKNTTICIEIRVRYYHIKIPSWYVSFSHISGYWQPCSYMVSFLDGTRKTIPWFFWHMGFSMGKQSRWIINLHPYIFVWIWLPMFLWFYVLFLWLVLACYLG
jgi:hypothetical protein